MAEESTLLAQSAKDKTADALSGTIPPRDHLCMRVRRCLPRERPLKRDINVLLHFQVFDHARELGGFLSFSACTRNHSLYQRCEELLPLFQRLRRSLAPVRLKLATLATKKKNLAQSPTRDLKRGHLGCSDCPPASPGRQSLGSSRGRCQCLFAFESCPTMTDPGFFKLWNSAPSHAQ